MIIEQTLETLKICQKRLLADTLTPVGIYMQVRDMYPMSILLESSDYHGNDNNTSFICCEPIATISLVDNKLSKSYPNGDFEEVELNHGVKLIAVLEEFKNELSLSCKDDIKDIGLFGYMCYDIVKHFVKVELNKSDPSIPIMTYSLYRFVVSLNHFNETITLTEIIPYKGPSLIDEFENIINRSSFSNYGFSLNGSESSNFSDYEFVKNVEEGIKHCKLGDVFQIVLSRRFQRNFLGDDFNVYRALRTVNPSPYLFYFDYGSFKLMGSSPESQLEIKNGKATIHPIAGTFRRTGNDHEDAELAKKLSEDKKENSEHVMLVDLARNDLSKSSRNVNVEVFKEVQYYSHVLHLVSKVTGQIDMSNVLQLVADTFPAGTLSGAPKHKAMQLIDLYEQDSRGFYGGAIGYLGLDGSFNHAIMIRSLLSKNNQLTYQAGAGVVSQSNSMNELKEVDNKLVAIRKAIDKAEII